VTTKRRIDKRMEQINSESSSTTSINILSSTSLFLLLVLILTTTFIMSKQKINPLSKVVSNIYDRIIVKMTETWYRHVLERQEDGSVILDVGVGTAAALLKCSDIVKSKNLQIIGIDYNNFYIEAATENIQSANMSNNITVHCIDIYDQTKVSQLVNQIPSKAMDSIYFSGSFSLLPNPSRALQMMIPILNKKGKIYITQTYQRHSPPLLGSIKPLLKYVTTIDFGQLVKEEEMMDILKEQEGTLEVLEHEVMKDSLDTKMQAAYLTILKVKST